MKHKYFFSPGLDECAGCSQRMSLVNNFGTVVLDAPGNPQLYYTLCAKCSHMCRPGHIEFMAKLERRLVNRAAKLGAYTLPAQADGEIGK